VIHARPVAVAVAVASVMLTLALWACAGRAASASDPAEPTEIAARTEYVGIAPELVYVTEVDGFDLWPQSVGVMGDDGMSATYGTKDGGRTVALTTDRHTDPSVARCAELPDAAAAVLRCSVQRGEAYILLEGDGVDPETLRTAADAVRVPTSGELGDLFAELPTPQGPVERPDLQQGGEGQQADPPALGG